MQCTISNFLSLGNGTIFAVYYTTDVQLTATWIKQIDTAKKCDIYIMYFYCILCPCLWETGWTLTLYGSHDNCIEHDLFPKITKYLRIPWGDNPRLKIKTSFDCVPLLCYTIKISGGKYISYNIFFPEWPECNRSTPIATHNFIIKKRGWQHSKHTVSVNWKSKQFWVKKPTFLQFSVIYITPFRIAYKFESLIM